GLRERDSRYDRTAPEAQALRRQGDPQWHRGPGRGVGPGARARPHRDRAGEPHRHHPGERARLRERAQEARVPAPVPAAPAGGGGTVSAMTMTEKILARAAGKTAVEPGDNVWVRADVLMTHDVCGPGTIGIFKREFGRQARVWDRDRVVIIPDHYIFTKHDQPHRNVDI